MDCLNARELVKRLHDVSKMRDLGTAEIDLAVSHMRNCTGCRDWFSKESCPKMKTESNEEVLMGHGMLHKPLGIPCSSDPTR